MINIREKLFDQIPEIALYNEPVSDSSIIGVAVVNDSGPTLIAAYDEECVLDDLCNDFSESDDPFEDAIDWYNFNIIGGYIGKTTPVFVDSESLSAVRFNQYFEEIKSIRDFKDIESAKLYINDNPREIILVDMDYVLSESFKA